MSAAEIVRLSALSRCRILDTSADAAFDALAAEAARAADCPMAMISLIDRERIWLKATHGFTAREYPRSYAPCALLLDAHFVEVADLARDARFRMHPLVSAAPYARFYAAAAIRGPSGDTLGALAVVHTEARHGKRTLADSLHVLADAVSARIALDVLRDQRLLKSEALLSAAQRIARIGCWEWDMRNNELTWSDAMFTIFDVPRGVTPTLALFNERVHPEDRAGMNVRMGQCVRDGLTHFPDYRVCWRDGSVHVLAASSELELDRDGTPMRLTGAVQDVTDQRLREHELQQLTTQMLHAQKLESLGVLSAGVAHDFNNLLVGMLGNAELAILDPTLVPRTQNLLQHVISAARQAAGLTRQLLAYTGRGHLAMQNIDLGTHVRGIVALARASLPKSARLIEELTPALPAIRADVDQLQQITLNLILNAAESYAGTEGEVGVRTRHMALSSPPAHTLVAPGPLRPGEYVVLEVSDAGNGMDKATLARIFEPFFTTKFTGRGLGLAAVLGIVRGHGAVLTVDTAPGQGTTFRVYFQACDAPATEEVSGITSIFPEENSQLLARSTVLVVDDEASVRAVVRAVLESVGMHVLEAADGERALAILTEQPQRIDVMVLDLVMPGPSPSEVLTRARGLHPGLPVLIYSGFPEEEALGTTQHIDRRRNAFLQKPFSPSTLLEKMRTLLATPPPRAR